MGTATWKDFCCPACKGELDETAQALRCTSCGRAYPFEDGIPDLFIAESEAETADEPNKTWLDPKIAAARDTVYRLSTRELEGMAFCMAEIGKRAGEAFQRTGEAPRILEVAAGTGHFTRWLEEVSPPEARIYAFDFSRPILKIARANTKGLGKARLFRANSLGRLPLQDGYFDIVLLRLAPLGPQGVPNVRPGFDLLRPGGWYFKAGWGRSNSGTPPIDWALQHGFERAELHEWSYWRTASAEERTAARLELSHLAPRFGKTLEESLPPERGSVLPDGSRATQILTREHLLVAQKPD